MFSESYLPIVLSMATRLQLRTTIRERLEAVSATPLCCDAAIHEYFAAAISAQGASFFRQLPYADPNDWKAALGFAALRAEIGDVAFIAALKQYVDSMRTTGIVFSIRGTHARSKRRHESIVLRQWLPPIRLHSPREAE